MSCIFCKIVKGDIPAYTIYEDEDFKVILDRFPGSLGHTLIIPKQHSDDIYGLPEDICEKIFKLAAKLSKKLKAELNFDGLNLLQNNGADAGQSVMHFHLHLIPRYKNDTVKIKWSTLDPKPEEFEKLAVNLTLD